MSMALASRNYMVLASRAPCRVRLALSRAIESCSVPTSIIRDECLRYVQHQAGRHWPHSHHQQHSLRWIQHVLDELSIPVRGSTCNAWSHSTARTPVAQEDGPATQGVGKVNSCRLSGEQLTRGRPILLTYFPAEPAQEESLLMRLRFPLLLRVRHVLHRHEEGVHVDVEDGLCAQSILGESCPAGSSLDFRGWAAVLPREDAAKRWCAAPASPVGHARRLSRTP